MKVEIDLTPQQETEIAQQAQESGLGADDYLQNMIRQTLADPHPRERSPQARPRPDRAAMLALLDDLVNTDTYGTAEEQREALEHLSKAIDADRPGQRRIFGTGDNPA